MINLIPFDAEYHSSNEKNLHLVCISITWDNINYDFWLNDNSDREEAKHIFKTIRDDKNHALLIWNASAEARVLLSLGLDPRKFNWIDLQLEYKMLTNHFDKFRYGEHLSKEGKKIFTKRPKPKWEQKTEEAKKKANGSKPTMSLICGSYKMAGIIRDKDQKDTMRDIILTKDSDLIEKNRKDILDYCRADISDLEKIWGGFKEAYREFFKYGVDRRPIEDIVTKEEVLYRGMTGARGAIMEWLGYPVNVEWCENLSKNALFVLKECADDINSQFEHPIFRANPKTAIGISVTQKIVKDEITKSPHAPQWLKTDGGGYSLSLENAFEKILPYRYEFPRGNLLAQFMRYLKLKQSLGSFIPKQGSRGIFDDLDSDGRVHPYLNPYGTQTGRYSAKAVSFIFAKSAWLRCLVQPREGSWMVSIDYKSEEALICALESGDEAMIEAYKSGDVYLDFAKRAGAIPQDGTKKQYKKERDLFKATYLGISYKMGAKNLALKLTGDTGTEYTQEEAQALIDKFYKAYPKYYKYADKYFDRYKYHNYTKLQDGFFMFGDNDNYRSITNFPIQGMGSCILRKAIELAQDSGLKLLFPLHDALYIEIEKGDLAKVDILQDCMLKAFNHVYDNSEDSSLIQFDIDVWGPGLEDGSMKTPQGNYCTTKGIYIDPRGKEEYKRMSKYLTHDYTNTGEH